MIPILNKYEFEKNYNHTAKYIQTISLVARQSIYIVDKFL